MSYRAFGQAVPPTGGLYDYGTSVPPTGGLYDYGAQTPAAPSTQNYQNDTEDEAQSWAPILAASLVPILFFL